MISKPFEVHHFILLLARLSCPFTASYFGKKKKRKKIVVVFLECTNCVVVVFSVFNDS